MTEGSRVILMASNPFPVELNGEAIADMPDGFNKIKLRLYATKGPCIRCGKQSLLAIQSNGGHPSSNAVKSANNLKHEEGSQNPGQFTAVHRLVGMVTRDAIEGHNGVGPVPRTPKK